MRILLRKINGALSALIGQSGAVQLHSSGVLSAPNPVLFGGFSRLMVALLFVLASVVGLLLAATAAVASAAPAPAHTLSTPQVLAFGVTAVGPFSTSAMLEVLENLKRPNTGLLNAFFPTMSQSQAETISFDVDEGKRYLAPFVSPQAPAPVKKSKGQRVDTFAPAYVKEKARYTPDKALRRSAGESFGGSISPEQRIQLAVSTELQDQSDRIMRRKEAMAFEALFTGKLVVTGDQYEANEVDFGRNAELEADHADNDLTGGDRWSETASNPMDNLDDMSEKTVKHAGSPILDVVLDSDAWKAFRKNKKVERDLELPKYDAATIMSLEPVAEGLQYKGQYGGYRIWVYTGFYTATNGTETKTMEGGYAICVGAIDGVQHQGAIQDEEAGLQPLEVYPKSWVTPDPSVRWIMSQSAPLVVPRRINACGVLKVLNDS